ncbi:MAG: hypothetical protein A3K10_15290 [Bacteroidetes bacterium RIFCSPLOWO2_12_FULL_31_6]|nr:MAG: hypothetical protein A3K10_15290 [Bacteroidetes bacterium RIFCSPLOWO2_12_FULL_31_6]
MKTILIKNLLEPLNYKDLKAVRSWCTDHDVLIIKQGKNEFVIESEFESVFEKPFVDKLKRKFGGGWEDAYRLYKDGNIPALNMINSLSSNPMPIYNKKNNENPFVIKIKEYEKKKNAA